jgi:imidazolonepropionase
LAGRIGTIEKGKAADLAVWRVGEPAELSYWIGADLLEARIFQGRFQ